MTRYRLGSSLWVAAAVVAAARWCGAAQVRAKIISPKAGEVVHGPKVAVRTWFEGDKATPVRGWQLTIDGEHHTMKRFETPLSKGQGTLYWDTTGLAPGEHAVRVHLYRYGREIGIAGVRVRLAGDGAEGAEAPSTSGPWELVAVSPGVKIITPRASEQVWGQVLVAVQAKPSENVKPKWVQLYADDRMIGLVNSAPYEIPINTARLADGEHVLVAVAVDDIGGRYRSAPVTIRVANGESAVAPAPHPPSVGPGPAPLPTGEPALTEVPPKGSGELMIGHPDVEEPAPMAAAAPRLLTPGEAVAVPLPTAVAPASLIKPYLPGTSISTDGTSTVGAPGPESEKDNNSSVP